MKRTEYLSTAAAIALVLALFSGSACFGAATDKTGPTWIDRIEKIHKPGYMDWITTAWATMLLKQGIISTGDVPKAAGVVLQLWEFDFAEDERKWQQFYKNQYFFDKRLNKELAGNMMIGRTQPSGRQMLEVRHHLMKRMCQIYDLQLAMLKLAEQHATTIMPGYTHERHAQPTTFGHYILSGFDAVQRSAETLEHGYHLMSLNEMGCGALAGTSWPIDRDLVSEYLGMEGLLENANDAVGYADGYLVVVTGLANVCNVLSRMALEMKFWSGVEYDFLEMGSHGVSFMMPQKSTNPNSLEIIGLYAGQVIGHLTSVAIAGLREPHGDTHGMLHLMDPTLAAL